MNALICALLAPVLAALALAVVRSPRIGTRINIAGTAAGFAASSLLAWTVMMHGHIHGAQFQVDAFNVYLIVLTSFVGMTTAIFSGPYMTHELELKRVTPRRMRLYHASFQGFMFTMLLSLSTNNLGVL